jgi:hypothetical protein
MDRAMGAAGGAAGRGAMRPWDGIRCASCGYIQSRRGWWLLDGWCFRCRRTNPIPEQAAD